MVQVQGKVRARLEVPADISEDALREQALALPGIIEETPNGVRTVIVRAPKLVNVVPAGTEGTVFRFRPFGLVNWQNRADSTGRCNTLI